MIHPPTSDTSKEQLQAWLDSLQVTEMGRLLCSIDWSKTSLGAIESWPQSLRTGISMCFASRFPYVFYWGPEYVQVYNDTARPFMGDKHPHCFGQPAEIVLPEVFEEQKRLFDEAQATGMGVWAENKLLCLIRKGFLEEIYFTFSYSPVRDESGEVAGFYTAVMETTAQVIDERRLKSLRDLATHTAESQTVEEAGRVAVDILAKNPADIPFALFYLVDEAAGSAILISTHGVGHNTEFQPASISLDGAEEGLGWPLNPLLEKKSFKVITDLEQRFGSIPPNYWPEPAHTAVILPVEQASYKHPAAFLIVGISPRLMLDEKYYNFLELMISQVATAIANAKALEEERKRAKALAEIDRAKTDFFSNVSHEFRTPLTLMLGPLEEMLKHADQLLPADSEHVDTAHRNALRLLKLVNSLLDFSRIEAGRTQASYRPTDLAACTAELASNFRSATDKAGLKLRIDCPPLPELIYIDRDMWEKIVLNLISNAFKHTFEGEIEIRLRWMNDHAELTVRDTGVGIPTDQLPQLFERFYRIPNARSRTYEGTGIGLSLVKELVNLHGGIIQVDSKMDAGTVFTVSIPSGKAHLPIDRIEAESSLASTGGSARSFVEEALQWLPDGAQLLVKPEQKTIAFRPEQSYVGISPSRQRIVLADDNADMLGYLQRLLAPHYEVIAVPDGQAALNAIHENPPDLVLTDVMMPGLDGFGLLRRLREDPQTRTLPVVMFIVV